MQFSEIVAGVNYNSKLQFVQYVKIHNCGEVRLIPVTTYHILSVWGKSEREQFKMKYGLSTNFGKRELQEVLDS